MLCEIHRCWRYKLTLCPGDSNSMYLYSPSAAWWVSCIRLKAFSAFGLFSLSNGNQQGSVGTLLLSALLGPSDTQRHIFMLCAHTVHASYHHHAIHGSNLMVTYLEAIHHIIYKWHPNTISTITLLLSVEFEWCFSLRMLAYISFS